MLDIVAFLIKINKKYFVYHGLSIYRCPGQYSIIQSFTFYLCKYVILHNPPQRQSLGLLRDSDSPLGPQPACFRFFRISKFPFL